MQLGVNDIKRLQRAMKSVTNQDCFKWQREHNPKITFRPKTIIPCQDWLCMKILPPDIRKTIPINKKIEDRFACPCDHMNPQSILKRVYEMIQTGKTLD